MVTVLGTSILTVGGIEGIAEATGQITKMFSGALSDRLGNRKVLVCARLWPGGLQQTDLSARSAVKFLIAARVIDRFGKGIRGAPRDALVADLSPSHLRGASFGLRQSLDTVGAFLGPAHRNRSHVGDPLIISRGLLCRHCAGVPLLRVGCCRRART